MTLPVDARVRATPNFLACLRAGHDFMVAQDATSAPERFAALQAALVKARALLVFAPTSGRPARFLVARSDWGRFQASQAVQFASELGMPTLRELVVVRHVLLYAHSERDVALLSLKHERQAGYPLPTAA
jgi:hypothetical protein